MGHKMLVYTVVSTLLSVAVVHHAFSTRSQFFPAVVFLTTNRFTTLVLANMALVLALLVARVLKTIYLGTLRPSEVERVNDSLRYTIPEVCIALTMFREELSTRILSLFALLLFSKFFHVLADMRVDQMEVSGSAALTRLQHLRLTALLAGLLLVDALLIATFAYTLSTSGHSVLMLFAFEYVVLALDVLRCFYRYVIIIIAGRVGGDWGDKSLYLMYGKLGVDLVKLAVYFMYFLLLFVFYGMPIIMVRDLIKSFVEVNRELGNLIASRRLRAKINMYFPAPTAADLAAQEGADGGITCAVCMSEITIALADKAKKLRCNHIFHTACLLSWWERQQICPMCRANINEMMDAAERAARMQAVAAIHGAAAAPPAPAVVPPPAPAAASTAAASRSTAAASAATRVHGATSATTAAAAPVRISSLTTAATDIIAEGSGRSSAARTSAAHRHRHSRRRASTSSDTDSSSESSSDSSSTPPRRSSRKHRSKRAPHAEAAAVPAPALAGNVADTVAALQTQLSYLHALQAQLGGLPVPQAPSTPSAGTPAAPTFASMQQQQQAFAAAAYGYGSPYAAMMMSQFAGAGMPPGYGYAGMQQTPLGPPGMNAQAAYARMVQAAGANPVMQMGAHPMMPAFIPGVVPPGMAVPLVPGVTPVVPTTLPVQEPSDASAEAVAAPAASTAGEA